MEPMRLDESEWRYRVLGLMDQGSLADYTAYANTAMMEADEALAGLYCGPKFDYEDQGAYCVDTFGRVNILYKVVYDLDTEITDLDSELYHAFSCGPAEMLSGIRTEDITVPNEIGATHKTGGGIKGRDITDNVTVSFEDLLNGNASIGGGGWLNRFVSEEYKKWKEANKESKKTLDEYVKEICKSGQYDHTMDHPYLSFLSNVADFLIFPAIIKFVTGYDPLTGEDLSDLERIFALAGATIDVASIIAAIPTGGASLTGKAVFMAILKELAISGVQTLSATVTMALADALNLPPWVGMLAGMGMGIVIGKVGDEFVVKTANGTEIGRFPDPDAGKVEVSFKPDPPHTTGPVVTIDDLVNHPRTGFPGKRTLEPNTHYHVEGRGEYYTDANGQIAYVDTHWGTTSARNQDLINPSPNATYVVHHVDANGNATGPTHVYTTDEYARTVSAETDDYSAFSADRSDSIQQRIGNEGGADYDGGHLISNRNGTGGEDIGTVPMRSDLNQGGGEYYNLERELDAKLLELRETDPSAKIEFKVEAHYPATAPGGVPSQVPDSFNVTYTINGGPPVTEAFKN